MSRPRFITLEGMEGAGKSTQMARLEALIRAAGHTLVSTREPGGTPVGEALRGLLLHAGESTMSADTELLLMFAARAEHLAKVIRPALARGDWVLCDRFTDASYAYQGGGRGIDESRIEQIEDWVQGGLGPDRTLILDVPPAVGLRRVGKRGAADRFEREAAAFFARVREAYRRRAAQDPRRCRLVDTSGDLESASAEVRAALEDLL